MREEIIRMSSNIGSLVLYLKNRPDWILHIDENIPLGASCLSISEKIYYYVNNIEDILLCGCGNNRSFIGFKNGYRSSCGNKDCFVRERKKTCIEKYGVDNPKKSKEILSIEKENILKKWNGAHYMNDKSVRKKFNETMMGNWGVEWAQQSSIINKKSIEKFNENENKKEIIEKRALKIKNKSADEKILIQEKRKDNLIDKWGNLDLFYKHVSNKVREKSIQNYSLDHHLSHPDIIKKRTNTYTESRISKVKNSLPDHIKYISRNNNDNKTDYYFNLLCNNCNMEFSITRQLFVLRTSKEKEVCLHCNPILHGKSEIENEVYKFIQENYSGEVIKNYKSLISKELDIYLPDINIAFEFNGLYWHSEIYKDRYFHLNKSNECLEKGIDLFHIWEDDWIYKQDIIKSIILNKLRKSKKIWARNCSILEIDNSSCRNFLDKNHVQGFIGAKVKIGLFNDGELVSVMSFGSFRKSLGQSSKNNEFELLRFCNKLNFAVIGGASKLFKYFIKNYSPNKIISYSDISRSKGNMYDKLGFDFISQSGPNYYWVIDGIRKHRFGFRKDILVKKGFDPNKTESEIMNENGYYRIFDCGSKKWEFKNANL